MTHEKLKMLTRIMKMIYIYVVADHHTVYAVIVTGKCRGGRPCPPDTKKEYQNKRIKGENKRWTKTLKALILYTHTHTHTQHNSREITKKARTIASIKDIYKTDQLLI